MKPRPLLAFALPALLAACTGTQNRGLESVHQPVVSRTDYAFDVGTDASGLAAGEAQRLAGWLASLKLSYGDRVAIDDGAAGTSPAARAQIAGIIAPYGLMLSDGAPITQAAVAPGTLRVVVTRSVARVPGCPDFTRVQYPEFEGNSGSNHGCATNTNLAAMVARPEDLVLGQTGAVAIDPVTGARAVNTLRAAPPTGAGNQIKTERAKGGN
ncbi:MAG: pilus assembly protein CpaD [Proteobacteria bacterium SG_bin5]|nr:CpaD family pilus assembly protein [Sphingomonas sp.]OQW44775.1 MAG: pilus assembly protein CpaD [Proteobacteria bacterium SG_bin5]